MLRSGWLRPGSDRSRCSGSSCATAAPAKWVTAFVSPRPFCRAGRVGPGAWMRCCQSSTCVGSRWAISRRRWQRCSGRDAPNLSPSVIARLRGDWEADYVRWQRRDLSTRHYVYIWADGIYLQARMEPQAECMLVLIGATPEGKKELLGFQVGVRESAQSWRELLVDLKARGLAIAAELATGDGALGFWKALEEVSPTTRHQRCTVHKTANVLDKMPKSVQPAAKADLREIWAAPDRATAQAAVATFAEKYRTKYAKAVTCLIKDRAALLTFYDFPAEHWDHLRTSNPIESVFATVRHRTVRTKGALSQDPARLMVFKLVMAAAKTWRRLKGENQLPKVVQGVTFRNGVEVINTPAQNAA